MACTNLLSLPQILVPRFMMPPLEYGLPLDQLVACHECDLLLRKPTLKSGERSDCPRCGYELDAHRYNLLKHNLALVVTALQLYVPANLLPIMHLKLLGQRSDDTVWGAVRGLYDTGMYGITTVVFLCSMAVPFLKFTCQLTVLLSIQLNFCLHYGIWFTGFIIPLLSAAILYIPANVLPIMTVNTLGQSSPATIMSGIITLIQDGMQPIAALVFIARFGKSSS